MTEETVEITNEEREYSLDDLSNLANVTPRTVRYYIVEGLLPPPITTGRNATYSQEHLDRLNAIASLKEMYLPLREIRHRLNTLTPEQMRDPAYLASLSQAVAMDRAIGKRHTRRGRRGPFTDPTRTAEEDANPLDEHGSHHGRHRREAHRGRHEGSMQSRSKTSLMQESVAQPASQTWERFPLGDDAELLIRSSKAQHMGSQLYRTLHRLRQMIEHDDLRSAHQENEHS